MVSYAYNDLMFTPPAPTLRIDFSHPETGSAATFLALIDSGDDLSVIPEDAVTALELEPVDRVRVTGVGEQIYTRYFVTFDMPLLDPIGLRAMAWPEAYAVVGRNLLNKLRLTLDGPQLQLTLEEP